MATQWTHGGDNDVMDPINLRFETTDKEKVVGDLEKAGWRKPWSIGKHILATDQWLHYGSQKKVQDEHRVKMRNGIIDQYHVRLWKMDCYITGSSHLEIWTPLTGHKVRSFERGEKELEDDLKGQGWTIDYDSENLSNYVNDPPNNGSATKITK